MTTYAYYEPGHDRPEGFKPRRSMRVHIAVGESRFPLPALCGITLRTKSVPPGNCIRYRALPEEPANERLCRMPDEWGQSTWAEGSTRREATFRLLIEVSRD